MEKMACISTNHLTSHSTPEKRCWFETDLHLSSADIHRDFLESGYDILRRQWTGRCALHVGYISEIDPSSLAIVRQRIAENGAWFIRLRWHATTLLPQQGQILPGVVLSIAPFGVFLQYREYLRFIVPSSMWRQDFTIHNNKFTGDVLCRNRDGKPFVRVGATATIEIIDVRFEDGKYSNIARFVLED